MTESTLTLTYMTLLQEVGFFLGYGRGFSAWTGTKRDHVDRIINSGLRQFYAPPPMNGVSHQWSFLYPVEELVTVASQADYDLPDTLGGIEGDLTFATDDNGIQSVRIVGENMIRRYRQFESSEGTPCVAAIRTQNPTIPSAQGGQRFELMLYPTPDAVYTLSYRMFLLPPALTYALPYPLGGAFHTETILESCLAAAELTDKNEIGPHYQKFMERLAASVAYDERFCGVEWVGNMNRSSPPSKAMRNHTVTFEGVAYDNT